MQPTIAFISQGRLFVKQPEQDVQEVESKFANNVLAKHQKNAEMNAWKDNTVWGSGAMAFPQLGQFQQAAASGPYIAFVHVCQGPEPGHLYYVVQMDAIIGVFQYVIEEDREIRLLHKNGFFLESISRHRSEDLFAMSVRHEGGTVRLSTSQTRIQPTNHVSGGPSLDQLPDWVRDGSKRLVYQSAPVGKDEQGFPIGVGSYAVEMLDVDAGKIETLIEDNAKDFLAPKMDSQNRLFFVERPYQVNRQQVGLMDLVKDVVYFPFRLARTAVYFFNFMSTMFTGKPIADSLNMNKMQNRQRFLTLWGRVLDTQKAVNRQTKKLDQPIAPKEWSLKCRDTDGNISTVAEQVLCFDITDDGDAIYSDGTSVFLVGQQGTERLTDGQIIQSVAVIK